MRRTLDLGCEAGSSAVMIAVEVPGGGAGRCGTSSERMSMISVTSNIAIDEREIAESFVRASGPGGQNVNTFVGITR